MLLGAILKNCLIGYHRKRNLNTSQPDPTAYGDYCGNCRMILAKMFQVIFFCAVTQIISDKLFPYNREMLVAAFLCRLWCLYDDEFHSRNAFDVGKP